jgi:hypothetical protein
MGIFAVILLIFGVYMFAKRRRGEKISDDDREFSARLGRSAHAALPLPGLTGQPPASMMPGPVVDEIGPESGHIVVIKGPDDQGEELSSSADLNEVRSRLDAMLPPVSTPPPRKPRRPRSPED